MQKKILYTVGHSTHEITYFIDLLKSYSVNCVVDVRALAASKFNPQYNKSALSASLRESGITYIHMPEEFGARHANPTSLAKGLERLRHGANKGFTIALVCAEADPLECHRFSVISVVVKNEFEVLHILKDKSIITNIDLESELLKKFKRKILTSDMFQQVHTHQERLAAAYKLQNEEIGYSPEAH